MGCIASANSINPQDSVPVSATSPVTSGTSSPVAKPRSTPSLAANAVASMSSADAKPLSSTASPAAAAATTTDAAPAPHHEKRRRSSLPTPAHTSVGAGPSLQMKKSTPLVAGGPAGAVEVPVVGAAAAAGGASIAAGRDASGSGSGAGNGPGARRMSTPNFVPPEVLRTKSAEVRERYNRQLSFLDHHYREKRVMEMKHKEAKLAKLNSDRSERLDAQWAQKVQSSHTTARELFVRMCEKYPYDSFKYEHAIKSYMIEEEEDDFGVRRQSTVATDGDEDEWDETLWCPADGNIKEILDEEGFFACLKELLLFVPTKQQFRRNLSVAGMHENDVKMMEIEIEKQRKSLWSFFIYSAEEMMEKKQPWEMRTYMTYDDFMSGLSGLITATLDWTSREHKQISDTLFQIMDHDCDGYLDTHDIKALLLSLHQMYTAVFNYQSEKEINREAVEEQAAALLGMDWGPNKEEQPVQFLNKRQFAHLFGELGESHLKDLDLSSIFAMDLARSPRSLRM